MIPNVEGPTLQTSVRDWVETGTTLYSDSHPGYRALRSDYNHHSVAHTSSEYVRGDVHKNSIENFWTLYKRARKGTYTHNLVKHTNAYVNERVFAINNREMTDLKRMQEFTSQVGGLRVTHKELKA